MSIRSSFLRMALGVATMLFTTALLAEGVVSGNGGASTMAASEAHLGETGTNQTVVITPMTTSASAYTLGKSIGGIQTITGVTRVSDVAGNSGTSGNILSTIVTFVDNVTVPVDVWFFNASPTSSNCTDNVANAIGAADRDKVFGVVHVTDINGGPPSVLQAIGPPVPYTLNNSTTIYACVIAKGAITLTGTANASLNIRVLRQ